MHNLLTTTILALAVGAIGAQQPSLREQAKDHDVNLVINSDYAPATINTIVSEADAIIVGRVDFGKALLASDENQLFTDYQVTVERVVKPSRSRAIVRGDALTVRRWGGVMNLENHNVIAEENDFPPFDVSSTYVLFLTSLQGESFYYVAYGPQGAFTLASDDTVAQVSNKFGSWNREHGRMPTAEFIEEIRRLTTAR